MNTIFAEATTSTAFVLTLSKRSCHALLMLSDKSIKEIERLYVLGVDALQPLDRRGLVFWHRDANGGPCGFGGLTRAGELTAALLREAGMTLESTGTKSTTSRRQRLAETT